ncbi:hypothetical protein D3C77_28690 [compost metagenome]
MIEIKGDLFDEPCDAFCITTNGFVKPNGAAVMGRGCALTAKTRLKGIDKELGSLIKENGNIVQVITWTKGKAVLSFPVKPEWTLCKPDKSNVVTHQRKWFKPHDMVPGYASLASLVVIERSAHELVALADTMGWKKVVLTKPGCKNGQLGWVEVRPVLSDVFDDRFHVIDWG